MRIAIDARAYSWAGIGRYIRNIVRHLPYVAPQHEFILLLSQKNASAYTGPLKTVIVDSTYYSWREQIVLWRQLQAIEADLWHFTHFNVPWFFNRPYVVTIHDVTRFVFPGQRRQSLRHQMAYEALLARIVRRAQHIITVSQTTAEELAALPIAGQARVTTIYEGVEDIFFTPVSASKRIKIRMLLGCSEPYLLYVGVWMSHKNLERLMQAYVKVRQEHPRLRLVVTGRPAPGYINVIEMARRLSVDDTVIFPGFVPDDLMPALYASAACFVWPSLYEGFGLPILEAAACGVPVVTSNVSSMAEILGGACVPVNPESVDSIAAGILAVVGQPEGLALVAGRLGAARARSFRWRRAAEQHRRVYETIRL